MNSIDKVNELHKRFKKDNPDKMVYETINHRMNYTTDYVVWLHTLVSGVNSENEKALPIHIVRVCAWADANELQKEPFIEKAAELAQDTLFCSRVWSAWSYGTMTDADFSDAAEDEDFIDAIACAIWEGH